MSVHRIITAVPYFFLVLFLPGLPSVAGQGTTDLDTSPKKTGFRLQILSINDFHGQISEGATIGKRPVGSAPVLIAYLRKEQQAFDGPTFLVHAGDLIGASMPESALLQDEPTMMVFNTLQTQSSWRRYHHEVMPFYGMVGIPGNHEFDEGIEEFLRLLHGGNHKNGPFLQNPWNGATFSYLGANFTWKHNGRTICAPFLIYNVKGVEVAFIGVTAKETPFIVNPSAVADVQFFDEVAALNETVENLIRKNIRTIIVIMHQGGYQDPYEGPTDLKAPPLTGPVVDIVRKMHGEVDVVISGHTHRFTNALIPAADGSPVLVTQAWSRGSAYGVAELEIDSMTHNVISKSARIMTTWADSGCTVKPDAESQKVVAAAKQMVDTLINRVIAEAASDIPNTYTPAGESTLGNLIADAQRMAMKSDFAFTNPGGIRASITKGKITWGQLYTIQPFNNTLVKMELTGQEVYDLLREQQAGSSRACMLQVSGLTYIWDSRRPERERVIKVCKDNAPIGRTTMYSVAVNSYLAEGGDRFTMFKKGRNPVTGPTDLEALVSYLEQNRQPLNASVEGRIKRVE